MSIKRIYFNRPHTMKVFDSEIFFAIKQGKYIFPLEHNHDYWEILFVERGNVVNSYNGEERILTKNELCVLHPDTVHTVLERTNEPLLFFNFEITPSFLEPLCKSFGFENAKTALTDSLFYFSLPDNDVSELMQLINKTQEPSLSSDEKRKCLRLLITQLISRAIKQRHFPKSTPKNSLVSKILSELENIENFKLTIEEICAKCSYSHEYITRLFKKENLLPPNKIFLKNKLEYACTFLLTSKITIIEIAQLCGIYSLSYFNRIFKEIYGISPSAYRKQNIISLE